MIDIAMLSCNRSRITELAIWELKTRTLTPYRLIVLDNGSEDDSQEMLLQLKDLGWVDELLISEENNGVHWGHNRLLEMVTGPLYVCADNDLIPQMPTVCGIGPGGLVAQDWLVLLSSLMRQYSDYAAIACRPHVLIGEPSDRFDDAPEIRQMSHVGAHLRLMRTEAVRDIGGWRDVKHPSRNDEERWICGKLRGAGYSVGYARDVRCIHLFGKSELGEDPWGYSLERFPKPQDHGHREISPSANVFAWDRQGIDWETCK